MLMFFLSANHFCCEWIHLNGNVTEPRIAYARFVWINKSDIGALRNTGHMPSQVIRLDVHLISAAPRENFDANNKKPLRGMPSNCFVEIAVSQNPTRLRSIVCVDVAILKNTIFDTLDIS